MISFTPELLEKRPWVTKYDIGVPPTINFPDIPAHEMLRIGANLDAGKAATWFYGTEISFWDLQLQVIRMSNAFVDLGIEKGNRVGLMLPNCPQFVISFWALISIGAIVVNLNPMYTLGELTSIAENTSITGLITFDALLPLVRPLNQKINLKQVIVTKLTDFVNGARISTAEELGLEEGWHHFSQLLDSSTNEVPPAITVIPDDPAVIQFTGGTTGLPKGAILTHHNLVVAAHYVLIWGDPVLGQFPLSRRFVFCVLPYFHVYGEIVAMCYSIISTSTQVILPRFEIEEVMNTLALFDDITFFPAVPTMINAVLNHPRAEELNLGVKFGLFNNGAAPCPLELIQKAKDMNVFISEGWGMSETTSLGICNPFRGLKKPLSIGLPFPGTDIKIVDINTRKELPRGEIGEIVMRSPLVMKGYWNNPEETANQLKDGWLYTGDVAYMDEDGYIFIVDRTKDLIIAGGFNIYPRDIDEVIFKHPQVKDVITVGIPDEYRGETVKSFVQLVEGATVTEEEIISYCREHLAPYKVPTNIEFRSELPRSTVGKALRRLLREGG